MGLVNFGVPEKEVEYLKNTLELNTFVEGGTYKGGTAKNMSSKFSKVFTIEKSDVMYEEAKETLKNYKNVTMLKGDTRDHLRSVLHKHDNILFWLDAHWSGGDTYGEDDECPLIEELEIIFGFDRNQVILIDDARLFLAPPPHPHSHEKWPSIIDIAKVVPVNWELIEFEDVIYLFDNKYQLQLKSYFQKSTTSRWKDNGEKLSVRRGLNIAIKGLFKGAIL